MYLSNWKDDKNKSVTRCLEQPVMVRKVALAGVLQKVPVKRMEGAQKVLRSPILTNLAVCYPTA
jgi:hypothetical protein